ncbi:hypothetical protein TFLX_06160 [Thermoflexales bacterium]|nr:hypothetical protein TFLX_06160 [Thermoflexales bacterium]
MPWPVTMVVHASTRFLFYPVTIHPFALLGDDTLQRLLCYTARVINQRRVLIVRVWWEYDFRLAKPVMRGSLQQLGSEALHYFNSLEVLPELVRAALSSALPGSADGLPTDVS